MRINFWGQRQNERHHTLLSEGLPRQDGKFVERDDKFVERDDWYIYEEAYYGRQWIHVSAAKKVFGARSQII